MKSSDTDDHFLKEVYQSAAAKYRPREISTLIIAESPPCALDRYFYFEDVKTQDSLFLEIMGMLYPNLKSRYLKSRRDTALKEELLENFMLDGYWLTDLSEIPGDFVAGSLDACVPGLLKRLEKQIKKTTPIILIKANVYDTCFRRLSSAGYHVTDLRIPFPGSGQQGVFRKMFRKALEE